MLLFQTNHVGLNYFLMQTLSFVPMNLHRCWSREWKRSVDILKRADERFCKSFISLKQKLTEIFLKVCLLTTHVLQWEFLKVSIKNWATVFNYELWGLKHTHFIRQFSTRPVCCFAPWTIHLLGNTYLKLNKSNTLKRFWYVWVYVREDLTSSPNWLPWSLKLNQ